ncbi:PepSY-associated TM helix domain-containing protein [Halomonas huangheensis]|uniref:PepSY domain-containing protein n=1 Tax=Halomonas huangheensis TaxID=1178482 RepID=W1NB88_9GAMM|nr:PepSY-associated TM helix domain-containing protein [Halomonas huangheensis]ALM53640.1 hypothetical protein AR456_16175 [Halomonas huangheensis]ERL52461.1 hypothetical protein BJB45_10875 [Halomonas huangheensis]
MTTTTSPWPALKALVIRLHLYIGLLIGPFIFIAALTGTLYALTPAIERAIFHDALTTSNVHPTSEYQPLSAQIAAAQAFIGSDAMPSAIRPAPQPGATSRVMFNAPDLGASEHRAIFIDPATLEVRDDLTVYGTSGSLPLRRIIDQTHRSLMQGDVGRLYSELAASWLWIAALGGLTIWWFSPGGKVSRDKQTPNAQRLRTRRRHSILGLVLLVGLLALSATGMTWSKWAGANFAAILKAGGWGTPHVMTDLHGAALPEDPHAHHRATTTSEDASIALSAFDRVLSQARSAGLDAGDIELQVPATGKAWKVREIDRSWPSQVDEVAIHPQSFAVIDQVKFEQYSIPSKLTRWGIDGHMGVLFGLPNQLLLAGLGIGIMTMIVWGYSMWWRRRTLRSTATLWQTIATVPARALVVVAMISLALGYAMPVMGVSLVLLLIVDGIRTLLARRSTALA